MSDFSICKKRSLNHDKGIHIWVELGYFSVISSFPGISRHEQKFREIHRLVNTGRCVHANFSSAKLSQRGNQKGSLVI